MPEGETGPLLSTDVKIIQMYEYSLKMYEGLMTLDVQSTKCAVWFFLWTLTNEVMCIL